MTRSKWTSLPNWFGVFLRNLSSSTVQFLMNRFAWESSCWNSCAGVKVIFGKFLQNFFFKWAFFFYFSQPPPQFFNKVTFLLSSTCPSHLRFNTTHNTFEHSGLQPRWKWLSRTFSRYNVILLSLWAILKGLHFLKFWYISPNWKL